MAVFLHGGQPVPKRGPILLDNFADNEWSAIIWACQNGMVPATWAVADQKTMLINDTDYLIDIIGIEHDDYADGSGKAPLTFQLHEVYAETVKMNTTGTNVGGWDECDLRANILPEIMDAMPYSVKNNIREVAKYTGVGNMGESLVVSSDKLFLLSEVEVFGTDTYSAPGEGSQYAYYLDGGDTIKNSIWFLRSPAIGNTTNFCLVTTKGLISNVAANRSSTYTSFAFCF